MEGQRNVAVEAEFVGGPFDGRIVKVHGPSFDLPVTIMDNPTAIPTLSQPDRVLSKETRVVRIPVTRRGGKHVLIWPKNAGRKGKR